MARRIESGSVWVVVIILVGLALRLRGITNPLLDDQAWRQADTASMAWHMAGRLGEIPAVFAPQLSYDGTSPQNVELEFPFLPYLLAWSWQLFGWADIFGRGWAILCSLLTIVGVYYLGSKTISRQAGLIAAGVYAVLPLTVYYGRVVMPEPVAQVFSVWALVCLWQWRNSVNTLYQAEGVRRVPWLAGILMACAILAKLPQLMIFPVALVIGFWPWKKGDGKYLSAYTFLALLPPMIYYVWVHLMSGQESQFVSTILTEQVLTGTGIDAKALFENSRRGFSIIIPVIALYGVVKLWFWQSAERLWLRAWVIIVVFYVLVAAIRIPLDYYLIPVALLLALLVGLALDALAKRWRIALGISMISLLLLGGYWELTAKYAWDEQYLIQAEWIRENTPETGLIVLSDAPPMTFYYARRVGFRLLAGDDEQALADLAGLPADYLVRLPHSERGETFWASIAARYEEAGPGVFRLKR